MSVYGAFLNVYQALWRVYRALLSVYRALFGVKRALLNVYGGPLSMYRAFLNASPITLHHATPKCTTPQQDLKDKFGVIQVHAVQKQGPVDASSDGEEVLGVCVCVW